MIPTAKPYSLLPDASLYHKAQQALIKKNNAINTQKTLCLGDYAKTIKIKKGIKQVIIRKLGQVVQKTRTDINTGASLTKVFVNGVVAKVIEVIPAPKGLFETTTRQYIGNPHTNVILTTESARGTVTQKKKVYRK